MCLSSLRALFALCSLLAVSILPAQQIPNTAVPNLIRYGGTLKDAQGAPLVSSTVGVTFAIYNQQDGGAGIWMETQNVNTDAAGNYSVVLGSTTAAGLPGDLFSQQEQRWLGVQVQGQIEQPRVLLVSVPYAFKAHEAETLGGKSVSDFMLANGATSPANSGGTVPAAASITNNTPVPNGVSKGAASAGPTNFSGSTTDHIVGVTQNGTGYAIAAQADSKAIVGTATDPSATAYGVQGVATGTAGVGLIGTATSTTGFTYGLRGTSSSTSGTGVRGIDMATSGVTTGVSGYVASAAGIAGAFNNEAGGKIISGQNNGTEKFSVDGGGNVNSLGTYRIGGNSVLSIGGPSDFNLFLGVGAGSHNVAGDGQFNVFSGSQAGFNNTIGGNNVFSGYQAGYRNTSGSFDTFSGDAAGFGNTTGFFNTFYGYLAGSSNTTGAANTFVGNSSGINSTGQYNTFYGNQAGYNNTTGNNNIYISNEGTGTESNTIRIGGDTGDGPQTAAYIVGIYGSTTSSGSPLFVDSTGKLGTGGGSALVTSFNGRTGAVLPADNDYSFGQLSGTLARSQLSGTYSAAVDLNNGSNSFTGNGAGLTGVQPGPGSANYIQNGTSQQAGASFNISGTGTANGFASATTYQIAGSGAVLSVGNLADDNLFLGLGAGLNNTTGSGNAFFGRGAGYFNSTGSSNTFIGAGAGTINTSGNSNIFIGNSAGYVSTGNENIFIGTSAGVNNTTGNNNIYISNEGTGTENNTIRIGTQGTGNGQQALTYIAGIYGSTVNNNGVPVYVDNNGQLGTVVSSRRFKEQIADMGDSTSALMSLRPVTFLYKPEYAKGDRTLQYGLIAEEVAQVYPELVAYDQDGQPYTVRYQYLTPMLLNEAQKQYRRVEEQSEIVATQQVQMKSQQQEIAAQQQQIESLKQQLQLQNDAVQERLSRLEKQLGN
jgi:trimeric autotransporter adhesin